MALKTLKDLYVDELKDLYSAEQQILKALPKMAHAATNQSLKDAFNRHLQVTEEQVRRLEGIFDKLGASPRGKKCKGIEGLIDESKEFISESAEPAVKDAGLISQAQRIEHYEMAGYGSVRTYAQTLGFNDAANALQQTLNEEGDADHKLTQLAESMINPRAEMNPRM
jgi:ferritin-like metal-binding protein YciE